MENFMKFLPKASTRRLFMKRTVLFRQGEVPRQVYYVRRGCVKVYRISNEGEEQVAGFKTSGDVFPESWAFGQTSNTMYYYETVEPSELISIEKNEFLNLIESNALIAKEVFSYMAKTYTGLMLRMSALEQSRATDKLLMTLYYLMLRHGVEKKKDVFSIRMRIRHTTLASLTGLARETITIELGRLKRKRVVYYDLNKFVIYRQALKDMIGDDSIPEMQL